ncbi:MAG: cytochrome c oxidase subunit 3 [Betaproteobacteria bacterium]|nr:cytochrome c oxidase subunit 3 [Betaproteobacteria bacterium]
MSLQHEANTSLTGFTPNALRMPAAKLGLLFFMSFVTVLFLLLTLAYLARAQLPDWQSLGGDSWRPLNASPLPWLNTLLLFLASLSLHAARGALEHHKPRGARMTFSIGGLCIFGFVLGQLMLWQQLRLRGVYLAGNPANSFFYLITALHGLHIFGGIAVWSGIALRLGDIAANARQRLHLQLCSLYWDFLFVLWLALFALLMSPRGTLDQIAGVCGLR